MQLIEIIQLVLIGFIVVSLIVFGFSYFGYRQRTKSIPAKKPKQMEILIKPEIDPAKVYTPIQTPDLQTTSEDVGKKTGVLKKNRKKFEVFKPSNDDSPILQSKAISIKPPQKSK